MNEGKIPPAAPEIERNVLGAILMDNSVLRDISLFLKPESFYDNNNKIIYKIILDLYHADKPIDLLVLTDELRKKKKLEDIGGPLYVVNLTNNISTPFQSLYHAQIIYQKYLNREMIMICNEIQNECYDEVKDIDDIIEDGTEKISAMLSMKKRKDIYDFNQALDMAAMEIEHNMALESNIYRTGYSLFDKYFALKPNTLMLVVGDKGTAKTNYLCSIGKGLMTLNNNVYILWFSMEDPKEKIIRRFISSECGLSDRKLLSIGGRMNENERLKIADAYKTVKTFDNSISFVDQKVDISLMKKIIRKTTEIAKSKDKELIVFVDNLGLIDAPGFKDDVARENFIAGEMVDIRAETKALIILIHHLNKSNLYRANVKDAYRPREEYIRGSSRILDYANQCALVNLPGKYADLMEVYRKSTLEMPESIPIDDMSVFTETFYKMNPNPDFYSNKAGIKDMKQVSFNTYTNIIMQDNYFDDGKPMGGIELYKRWIEYINNIDAINADRDPKFKKEVASLYTFFDKKMYNYKERINKDGREYYLFNDMGISNDKKHEMLQKLFIVDAIKIRDYNTGGDTLIRYEVDLNANHFTEL